MKKPLDGEDKRLQITLRSLKIDSSFNIKYVVWFSFIFKIKIGVSVNK